MHAARRILAHRRLAALLCAATLALRLLVPAGYMIGDAHGRPTIALCSGVAPAMEMPVMPGHGAHDHGRHDKAEMPCAFAGLSAASLGAIDPVQLAALIGFILAIGLSPVSLPAFVRRVYLRPPLRGPPLSL